MTNSNSRIQTGNIDNSGEVNIAGRDIYQSIQNIIVVGQLLDYAKIKHLLPNATQNTNFTDIQAVFKTSIQQHGAPIAEAVSHAGEIIREILQNKIISNLDEAFIYQQFIREIAAPLIKKLKSLRYWSRFHKVQSGIIITFDTGNGSSRLNGQVVWLESLYQLRKNLGRKEKNYGLALVSIKDKEYSLFIVNDKVVQQAYNPLIPDFQNDRNCDFSNMSEDDFRLFMTGLTLDVIRLCSQTRETNRFLQQLLDVFDSV